MKINKKKLLHWLYLLIFTINVIIATLIRLIARKTSKNLVLLYGHKLNGNLKALYDYADQKNGGKFQLVYLTMDFTYYNLLKTKKIKTILATKPSAIRSLINARCIVSDHGLHSLVILLKFSNIHFIDVWHGIPFKGFNADDFKVQQNFSEVWLTSELLKNMYEKKFGFTLSKLKTTGYARTDILINRKINILDIRKNFELPINNKKIILFAPTWQQDQKSRSIYPFGLSSKNYFSLIDDFCKKNSAICLLRTHLNTQSKIKISYSNIHYIPHSTFPQTEEILLISDILVCDWSSIAFDYLLLNRPTIFLDVPPPFKKGFSLGPEYRFGEIVNSTEKMIGALTKYIQEPDAYRLRHEEKCRTIRNKLYDKNADGNVSMRCYRRLEKI